METQAKAEKHGGRENKEEERRNRKGGGEREKQKEREKREQATMEKSTNPMSVSWFHRQTGLQPKQKRGMMLVFSGALDLNTC